MEARVDPRAVEAIEGGHVLRTLPAAAATQHSARLRYVPSPDGANAQPPRGEEHAAAWHLIIASGKAGSGARTVKYLLVVACAPADAPRDGRKRTSWELERQTGRWFAAIAGNSACPSVRCRRRAFAFVGVPMMPGLNLVLVPSGKVRFDSMCLCSISVGGVSPSRGGEPSNPSPFSFMLQLFGCLLLQLIAVVTTELALGVWVLVGVLWSSLEVYTFIVIAVLNSLHQQ
jgi:hypothetical protein